MPTDLLGTVSLISRVLLAPGQHRDNAVSQLCTRQLILHSLFTAFIRYQSGARGEELDERKS